MGDEGSIIITYCWRGCKTGELRDAGYDNSTVNHKYNFVDPNTGCHTQSLEVLWVSKYVVTKDIGALFFMI